MFWTPRAACRGPRSSSDGLCFCSYPFTQHLPLQISVKLRKELFISSDTHQAWVGELQKAQAQGTLSQM